MSRHVSRVNIEMVVDGHLRRWEFNTPEKVEAFFEADDATELNGFMRHLRDETDCVRIFDDSPDRDSRGRKMQEAER